MEGYKAGNQLVTYIYKPTLYVSSQLEGEIGYGIKCECPWEPEHQCSIEICGGEPNERKNLSYSMRNDSLLGKRVKPGYNYACMYICRGLKPQK